MKNIFYFTLLISLVFTSCDPMDDIYEDIDKEGTIISGDAEFAMEDGDYGLTEDETVETNKSFSNYDEAVSLIPTMLANKYPVWGKESSAIVSFDVDRLKTLNEAVVYEVTAEDYDTLGFSYGNFSSTGDFTTFLTWKYENAIYGDYITLTYNYYSGGLEERTSKFMFTDEWLMLTVLTDDDYIFMGASYKNFDDFDDAEFSIGRLLGTQDDSVFAKENDTKTVVYLYSYTDEEDNRQYVDVIANYTFVDSAWMLTENTVKFGHNGTKWEKDNTIKYTLTGADYELVGNGYYKNFSVSSGQDEGKEEVRLEKINTILANNFPDAAEGQKYLISYNAYNGAHLVWTMKLIKQEGVYVIN